MGYYLINKIKQEYNKLFIIIIVVILISFSCGISYEISQDRYYLIEENVDDYIGNNKNELFINKNIYYRAVIYENNESYITVPVIIKNGKIKVSRSTNIKFIDKNNTTINYYNLKDLMKFNIKITVWNKKR